MLAAYALESNEPRFDESLSKFTMGQAGRTIHLPESFVQSIITMDVLRKALPKGCCVRVPRLEMPDRKFGKKCMIPGLLAIQIAPDIVLHMPIREAEWLMKHIQEIAIKTGTIMQLNTNLETVGVRFRVTKVDRGGADGPGSSTAGAQRWQTGGYQDVKLDGVQMLKILASVQLHGKGEGSVLYNLPDITDGMATVFKVRFMQHRCSQACMKCPHCTLQYSLSVVCACRTHKTACC
jgi:hypothetical protein